MTQALSTIPNTRTREEWAQVINADWRKSIESIIQTGRDLAAAKAELPHGEFGKMVDQDLIFTIQTADKLMKVAGHPAIANYATSRNLPPSWTVLSQLTSLSEADFTDAQERGLVTPDTTIRDARAVTRSYKDKGGTGAIGEGDAAHMLPTPLKAREIARETGRMVAASDGNIYSGASEQEERDHAERRNRIYAVIDAVDALADCQVSASAMMADAETHWLQRLRLASVEDAMVFLNALHDEMSEGLVNA